MEIRQLEVFTKVAEWESFSEAARRLFLTQPTVSTHIRQLEEELNIKLFHRTTKHLEITNDGKRLYQYANSILSIRDKIYREFHDGFASEIRLGASTLPSAYLLPQLLPDFQTENPAVSFRLWQSDSLHTIEKVREGSLDLGIVGTKTQDTDCVFMPFCEDELVIATPASPYFRKMQREDADWHLLLQEPLIMREEGSGTLKESTRFLEREGISVDSLHIVAHMNDPEAIKKTISNGMGISIISHLAVREQCEKGQLLAFHLSKSTTRRNMYLVYKKGTNLPQIVKKLINYLLEADSPLAVKSVTAHPVISNLNPN